MNWLFVRKFVVQILTLRMYTPAKLRKFQRLVKGKRDSSLILLNNATRNPLDTDSNSSKSSSSRLFCNNTDPLYLEPNLSGFTNQDTSDNESSFNNSQDNDILNPNSLDQSTVTDQSIQSVSQPVSHSKLLTDLAEWAVNENI